MPIKSLTDFTMGINHQKKKNSVCLYPVRKSWPPRWVLLIYMTDSDRRQK